MTTTNNIGTDNRLLSRTDRPNQARRHPASSVPVKVSSLPLFMPLAVMCGVSGGGHATPSSRLEHRVTECDMQGVPVNLHVPEGTNS